ncbi:MAG: hypothetical protein ACRDT8_26475 [Micromonosporaceae bacterium]
MILANGRDLGNRVSPHDMLRRHADGWVGRILGIVPDIDTPRFQETRHRDQ